jgi:F-type H+-transporting ATPase subunit epsilon
VATPFAVSLVTPEREVWSGQATIVVARGTEGEVGVMNGHVPMLIQLAIGPLFIETENERLAAAVDGGFLHVITRDDETRVDILAEHAELADEIDTQRAQQQRDRAEQRVGGDDDEEAKAELAKAQARLDLQR